MKKHFLVKSKVPVTWSSKSLQIIWKPKEVCINQASLGDWNLPTDDIDTLDNMYKAWDINVNGTNHSHSLDFNLNFNIQEILNNIPGTNHQYSFLKLSPGNCIPWHFDTYRTYIIKNNISPNKNNEIQRSIVMMDNWKIGQVIQFGKKIVSHWMIGDTFTWDSKMWHGAANFGNKDLIIMMITYQIVDKSK